MNESVLKKLAKPMLILAPIIWGTSFVVMKHSLDSFTPFYLLAFRFTAAAVVLGLVFWKSWKVMDRGYLKAGFLIGTMLFLAYAFQTFGLDRTTSARMPSSRQYIVSSSPFYTGSSPASVRTSGIFWPPLSAWWASAWSPCLTRAGR